MKPIITFALIMVSSLLSIGQSWTEQSSGTSYNLSGCHFVPGQSDTVYTVGTHFAAFDAVAHGFRTLNGSSTWNPIGLAEYGFSGARDIWMTDDMNGVVVGGGIKKTYDGGTTWNTLLDGPSLAGNLYDVKFKDALIGGAVGQHYDFSYTYMEGVYYSTTNGGTTWSEHIISSELTNANTQFNTIYLVGANTVFAGATNTFGGSTLYKSVNGGTTWTTLPFTGNIHSLYFMDTMTGFITSSNGIFQTTSGGTSWTQVLNTTIAVSAIHFQNSFGLAVCTNGNIYSTSNSGLNWTVMSSPVTTSLNDVKVISSQLAYAVGNNGKILKYVNNTAGCTSPLACNYNSLAIADDGSCSFPPSNDVCINAVTLLPGISFVVDNTCTLNDQIVQSCGGDLMKDLWYSFVYTGGNIFIYTLQIPGGLNNTRIALYENCSDLSAPIQCNDDHLGLHSALSISCTQGLLPGNTYFLQVGGSALSTGEFELVMEILDIPGCTNALSTNYSPCANFDDGSCNVACAGDLTGDGIVNTSDLLMFMAYFGTTCY